VVNNAIVLVDLINQLRERGMDRINAIRDAARLRLRPIMMTTLTTVLGLLPMAMGLGEGSEMRTPMAVTVIGGLLTSTVLTLVVVPVMYSLLDRRKDGSVAAAASVPSAQDAGESGHTQTMQAG
jgi:HAE1 family hydrophobic/amphiphilic exporter-1